MTEVDRVFSGMQGRPGQPTNIEQRIIQHRHRQGGASHIRTRVVEVVHVRRNGKRPVDGQANPVSAAEVSPEDFGGRPEKRSSGIGIAPATFEPPQPVVHVMPMWEPSVEEGQLVAPPDGASTEAPAPSPRNRRAQSAPARQASARPYANPFAEDEGGANCLRCGYLVEPERERRGWLTCATCGG